jgi:hypothetical protein
LTVDAVNKANLPDLIHEVLNYEDTVDFQSTCKCDASKISNCKNTYHTMSYPDVLFVKINAVLASENTWNTIIKPFKLKSIFEDIKFPDQNFNFVYTLFAIGFFIGNTKNSGHYICYIRHWEGESFSQDWFKYDDKRVDLSSMDAINKETNRVCLVVYRKIENLEVIL